MSDLVQLTVSEPITSEGATQSSWSDWIGVVASIGCAIHCAAMPFVIASLPALGLSFLADESFHKWMALVCFGIAVAAFVPGWRRHGRLFPGAVGMVGLTFIGGAAFGVPGECCASCEVESPEVVAVDTACTEECCECCLTEAEEEPSEDNDPVGILSITSMAGIAPEAVAPVLSRIAPWLTPIGGLILVAAHLLNRRFGCLCGCCDAPVTNRL